MWKQSLESLRDGAKEFANDFASEAREGVSCDHWCTLRSKNVPF